MDSPLRRQWLSTRYTSLRLSRRRSGETGRRAGLKIPCPQGRVGSIPTSGTFFRSLFRSSRLIGWPSCCRGCGETRAAPRRQPFQPNLLDKLCPWQGCRSAVKRIPAETTPPDARPLLSFSAPKDPILRPSRSRALPDFHNIDHEYLFRPFRNRCPTSSVRLYLERWLKAPLEIPDWTRAAREQYSAKEPPSGFICSRHGIFADDTSPS